jgi:AbrB family looped-hinge helix DNA binding protein
MAKAKVRALAGVVTAKLTSKGQITIPVEVRRSLRVKVGDRLRFEPQKGGFRVARHGDESVFEKWRGIGNFPGMGNGREAIVSYFRELRGHDDRD